jgi:hypothetical protein
MSEPLFPEILARLVLHLLERVEALEAAQQQPRQDKLDRLIALDRGDDEPTPEAAPVATDQELCNAYTNASRHGFLPALRAVYDLNRQHGICTSEHLSPAQPAPPPAPAGGLVKRVPAATWEAEEKAGEAYERDAISRVAIREVVDWLDLVGKKHSADELRREAGR